MNPDEFAESLGGVAVEDDPDAFAKSLGAEVQDDADAYAQSLGGVAAEAPQSPAETLARSVPVGVVGAGASAMSGVGRVRQAISDTISQYTPDYLHGLPGKYYDAITTVPRLLGPLAGDIAKEAERVYAPDATVNPKSAAAGQAIGQAPVMAAATAVAGPAGPLALGAASGADQGIAQAEEMGLTNPVAKLAMGGAYGTIEAAVESLTGFGNKAASDALLAPVKRTVAQLAKGAVKSTVGEGLEEVATGATQDAVALGFAPKGYDDKSLRPFVPSAWDVNPDYAQRRVNEFVGGAAGGAVFSGVDAIANAVKPAPNFFDAGDVPQSSSPSPAPVSAAAPFSGAANEAPGAANASEYFDSRFSARMANNQNYSAAFRAAVEPLRVRRSPEAELDQVTAQVIDTHGLGGATEMVLTTNPYDNGLTEREHIALAGKALQYWQKLQVEAEKRNDTTTAAKAQDASSQLFDLLSDQSNKAGSNLQVMAYLSRADPGLIIQKAKKQIDTAITTKAATDLGTDATTLETDVKKTSGEERAKAATAETTKVAQAKPVLDAASEAENAAKKQLNPQPGAKPAGNAIKALIESAITSPSPVADFSAQVQALGVTPNTARSLVDLVAQARKRAEGVARARAGERLVQSLLPKAKRAARSKIPPMIAKLLDAHALGMLNRPEFLKAYSDAFGLSTITPEVESKLRQSAERVRALPEGPIKAEARADLLDALEELKAPGDGLMTSVWYANLLSGASTQGINVFGNLSNLTLRSGALALVNRPADMMRYLSRMGAGLGPALREFGSAMQSGVAYKGDGKYSEVSRLERIYRKGGPQTWKEWAAVIGTVGPVGKYTGRMLTGADVFFNHLSREAYAGLAASKATRKTGASSGQAWKQEYANQLGFGAKTWEQELSDAESQLIAAGEKVTNQSRARQAWANVIARRPQELRSKTDRFGMRAAFAQDPEGSAASLFKLVNTIQETKLFRKVPIFRPFVPFARFAANALDNALDFTPVGAARAARGEHLFAKAGEPGFDTDERMERLGAALLGSAIVAAIGSLGWKHKDEDDVSAAFMPYAMGPSDPEKRKLMPKGWRPYTIKVGDRYWSYAETPLALAIAPVAAYLDAARYQKGFDEKSAADRLMYASAVSGRVLMKQGVLSSLDNLTKVLSGEKPVQSSVAQYTSGFIPASGALRDITRLFDPTKISGNTVLAAMFKDVPVVRNVVGKPDLDYWGQPVKNEGAPLVNRLTSGRREDPLGDWIIRNGLTLPGYPDVIKLGEYLPPRSQQAVQNRAAAQMNAMHALALTAEQEYSWHQRAGGIAYQSIQRTMQSHPTIAVDQREGVQRYLDAQVKAARQVAMAEMVQQLR
ncbi:MAG: hypothetical protein E6Q97_23060 [Desulfurellales bacterium]|nr:MAG: hypothetical protein E6Q97_23060 [Desulfurellales bacterium]